MPNLDVKEKSRRGLPLDDLLVIDCHGHLGNEANFSIPAIEPEAILQTMDRIGIDTLWVSHLMALRGDYRRGNDEVAEALRRYPGRFVGYAVPHLDFPDELEPELDRCFDQLGMQAIKIHGDMQGYPLDSPVCHRVYEYAQARGGGIPILGHGFDNPGLMAKLAPAYPDVTFLVAHYGGYYHGRFPDEMSAVIRKYDNVVTDLVATIAPYGGVEAMAALVGVEKLLYGSDVCYQEATHQIGRVLFAKLSDADKEKILGLNAARILPQPRAGAS